MAAPPQRQLGGPLRAPYGNVPQVPQAPPGAAVGGPPPQAAVENPILEGRGDVASPRRHVFRNDGKTASGNTEACASREGRSACNPEDDAFWMCSDDEWIVLKDSDQ